MKYVEKIGLKRKKYKNLTWNDKIIDKIFLYHFNKQVLTLATFIMAYRGE